MGTIRWKNRCNKCVPFLISSLYLPSNLIPFFLFIFHLFLHFVSIPFLLAVSPLHSLFSLPLSLSLPPFFFTFFLFLSLPFFMNSLMGNE